MTAESFPCVLLMVTMGTLGLSVTGGHAAETGDVDGDGRVSIADVDRLWRGLPPAEGSVDAFREVTCFPRAGYPEHAVPLSIYLQMLRSVALNPLPLWEGPPGWKVKGFSPLTPDPRVRLIAHAVSVPGGGNDQAELWLTLQSDAPIHAMSLMLQVDGGHLRLSFSSPFDFSGREWFELHGYGFVKQIAADIPVTASLLGYLITNGLLVVDYLPDLHEHDIEGGDYQVRVQCRLALNTPAGGYGIRILPSSQVVLSDGTLIAPTIVEDGLVTVLADVTSGWDEEVPPIEFDTERRQVLGKIRFRAASVQGFPGETVPVLVQLYTEVPLNHIWYRLYWPGGMLTCSDEQSAVLFTNPDDGTPYKCTVSSCSAGAQGGLGIHDGEFVLTGEYGSLSTYPDRPLEYFRPLNEWTDLTEILVTIPTTVGGGSELPLVFTRYNWEAWVHGGGWDLGWPNAEFSPYQVGFELCGSELWPDHSNWTYDFGYEDGVVRVLGSDPPDPPDPPPVDPGVRIAIGAVAGRPGGTVDIPVYASTELPLFALRFAFTFDSEILAIDEVEAPVIDTRDGSLTHITAVRGSSGAFYPCEMIEPGRRCWYGIPWLIVFYNSTKGTILVDMKVDSRNVGVFDDFPGKEAREVLRLRARILDPATGPEALIRPAEVNYKVSELSLRGMSGAYLRPPDFDVFVPATEAVGGTVTVEGLGFRRGDTNADERIDLTDAMFILLYLFQAGEGPVCADAADSDDNAQMEITDAIILLQRLFMGGPALAPPYPDCGADPTFDALGCKIGCSL